jgi:hypothetical protein
MGYRYTLIGCPFRSCLETEYTVWMTSLPGLAKVCGFFEVFLKSEPLLATDMPAGKLLLHALSSSPLIRMVYEANPAAISYRCIWGLPLHQCLLETPSIPFAMCTPCIQRLPAEAPGDGEQFCIGGGGGLENIRLAHSYCPENISVRNGDRFYPTYICEKCCDQMWNCSEVAMETVRFFLKHYPAGAAEALNLQFLN